MAHNEFYSLIEKFNEMYKLDSNDRPTLLPAERISNFQDILKEEVNEGSEIVEKYQTKSNYGALSAADKNEILTEMSDWLGDIVVYCASEARRWGIPLQEVLAVIMDSNFSKLDENGKPIYDNRGKVMKGPNYWRPEEKISELLETE